MEWSSFLENFTSALDKFSITREADKVAYLKAALKSRQSQNFVEDEAKTHSFSGMMKWLEARYYRPRKVLRKIVQDLLTSRLPSELGKATEVFRIQVMGAVHRILRGDYRTIGQLLTAICETQMNEALFSEWNR